MPSEAQARPLGVVVLSVVQLFAAAFMLAVSYGMGHGQVSARVSRQVIGDLASRAPYLALLAILPVALSFGLFLMANWARILALFMYCISLLGCILVWTNLLTLDARINTTFFNVLLVWTGFCGWAVIYLLRSSVARAFREAY
jgi:hypothetical protein